MTSCFFSTTPAFRFFFLLNSSTYEFTNVQTYWSTQATISCPVFNKHVTSYLPRWGPPHLGSTVDGWNPAPVDSWSTPLLTGIYTSLVVQDFLHQQYQWSLKMYFLIQAIVFASNMILLGVFWIPPKTRHTHKCLNHFFLKVWATSSAKFRSDLRQVQTVPPTLGSPTLREKVVRCNGCCVPSGRRVEGQSFQRKKPMWGDLKKTRKKVRSLVGWRVKK